MLLTTLPRKNFLKNSPLTITRTESLETWRSGAKLHTIFFFAITVNHINTTHLDVFRNIFPFTIKEREIYF